MAEIKPVTMANIAHGQLKAGFDSGIVEMHRNYMRQPDGEHKIVIEIKLFRDPATGETKIRPSVKVSSKVGAGGPGVAIPVVINEDGIFQSDAGKQMQLDGLDGQED